MSTKSSKQELQKLSPSRSSDANEAVELFRAYGSPAGFVVTPIAVDGPPQGAFRADAEIEHRLPAFIRRANAEANLYFHAGEVKEGFAGRKAKADDIVALNSLWADFDPATGEPPADCRARVKGLCQQLATAGFAPDIVVSTGGGVQVHWRTGRIPIVGPHAIGRSQAERWLRRLAAALGADLAPTSVAQLLRLPGTINHPTKSKRAKGRVPAPATILSRSSPAARPCFETVEEVEAFVTAVEDWAVIHLGRTAEARPSETLSGRRAGAAPASPPTGGVSEGSEAWHEVLPEHLARHLLSGFGQAANRNLERNRWQAAIRTARHACSRLPEHEVRDAILEFDARWEDGECNPEAVDGVLSQPGLPDKFGLPQLVRVLRERGWTAGRCLLAKLDFEGVPVNDNDTPGATGRAPRAPKASPADMSENADALAAMNEKHGVARCGSGVAVVSFGERGTVPTLMPKNSFFDLMAPKKLKAADGRRVQIAPVWFGWEGRKTFLGGMRMVPQGINGEGLPVPADVLNTWMGYVTEVAAGDGSDWPLIRGYLRDIVSAGDPRLYAWLLNWLAHLMQFPHDKPGTALILKGPQGAGKTTLTNLLRAIFHPAHVVAADRPEALLGKFNAHLREALVVIADEAVFAGDPAANNRLKAFVTDSTITVEQKGIDSVSAPSFHRLVMTSNEDHVISAETDARRWAVFDVSGERAGDASYFRPLYALFEPGNPEVRAFLRDLAAMSVDRDAVRRAPTTGGLIGQVIQSLHAPQQWLFELLRDALPASRELAPQAAAESVPYRPDFDRGDGEWPAYATREALTRSFHDWTAGRRYVRGNSTTALGKLLKLFGAPMQVKSSSGARRRVVGLGTLAEARAAFAAAHLRGVNDASVWGAEDGQGGD